MLKNDLILDKLNTLEMWSQILELRSGLIGGNVPPQQTVTLRTETVKLALLLQLLQSVIIALVLSITTKSFSPWIIPMSTLLQIGWIWNKITDYWKAHALVQNPPAQGGGIRNEELFATAASWPDVPPVGGGV